MHEITDQQLHGQSVIQKQNWKQKGDIQKLARQRINTEKKQMVELLIVL